MAAAKASYAEAQAVLANAVTNNKRIQQLKYRCNLGPGINPIPNFLSHCPNKTGCLRAQIESNQLRLAQTQVISPDNGVISARTAIGSLAQTGRKELFRLIRDHRLEWRAEVTTSGFV